MPVTINTNAAALVAQTNLSKSNSKAIASLSRISSGKRINSAKDDAAGLSISNQLRLDLVSLQAAQQNIVQGSAMLQIADGGLSEITNIMTRMKTLIATAQSDQITDTERRYLNMEYASLTQEITRIADSTVYNDIPLLNGVEQIDQEITANAIGANITTAEGFVGFYFDENAISATNAITVGFDATTNVFTVTVLDAPGGNVLNTQSVNLTDVGGAPASGQTRDLVFASVGATIRISSDFDPTVNISADNEVTLQNAASVQGTSLTFLVGVTSGTTITANIQATDANDLGIAGTNLATRANADLASSAFDVAFERVAENRARLGAMMSRLEYAASNVATALQNLQAAHSDLADTDVAKEMTAFTAAQILQQAGVSMLAQANQMPQTLLKLLG
jgi:flagellin